jgi:hypothetical protein
LNRALLARQHLLERSSQPVPRVVESMGLLQAQYAPSMYVGLWSRMREFSRSTLDSALADRSVVQGTLLRSTIHLVSREDYWPLALAIRDARRVQWLRLRKELSSEGMVAAAERLRGAFADAGGTLHRRDVEALLGRPAADAVGAWVDLVRVPPTGTWEHRRAHTYGLAEDWVGPPTEPSVALLVRRYLGAFGPARPREIANWAGLGVADLDLRGVARLDGGLVDLPGLPLPDPDTPAPVRFLPTYDAILLAHARRTQVLPEEHRPRVFNVKMPQSVPTFLVDGQVAGTWKHTGGRIAYEPFTRLDAATRRELDAEAARLADLHA